MVSKENTNNCLSVLKFSHLLVFPNVFFVLDERRDMLLNQRKRVCVRVRVLTYSDLLLEKRKRVIIWRKATETDPLFRPGKK